MTRTNQSFPLSLSVPQPTSSLPSKIISSPPTNPHILVHSNIEFQIRPLHKPLSFAPRTLFLLYTSRRSRGIHAVPMSEQPSLPSPPLLPNPILQKPSLAPLLKQKSWSPDSYREEAWLKKKYRWKKNQRRSKSVTDEDLDELKGCIELGFSFDSPDLDPKLSDTLPAYEFYYAVNKHYYDTISKSSGSLPASDCSDLAMSSNSSVGSPLNMFSPGDDPKRVKTILRQWAQVVACSVKQSWG